VYVDWIKFEISNQSS